MKNTKILLLSIFTALLFVSCDNNSSDTLSTTELEFTIEDNLSFNPTVVNITRNKKLTIINTGRAKLKISNFDIPNGFKTDWASGDIEPSTSKEVNITFAPTEITQYNGDITFDSNTSKSKINIPVSGEGISSIYKGDVILNSDEEVDNFVTKGFTEIDGKLCLGNGISCDINNSVSPFKNLITSLKPFSKIKNVKSLFIADNDKLTNLEGIEEMMISNRIKIQDVSNLKNIDQLKSITKLSGILTIFSNDKLENIDGLKNISELNGLNIASNPMIKNLNGLKSLEKIDGIFWVRNNPLINDFCDVASIFKAGITLNSDLYRVSGNTFNPTQENLVQGVCRE